MCHHFNQYHKIKLHYIKHISNDFHNSYGSPIIQKQIVQSTEVFLNICVFLCARVCVFMSIHLEGFICLKQQDCQGTDQRCYVEDVSFLCQVPSSLLQNGAPNLSNQLSCSHSRSVPRLNQCTSHLKHKTFIYHYQASPSLCSTS